MCFGSYVLQVKPYELPPSVSFIPYYMSLWTDLQIILLVQSICILACRSMRSPGCWVYQLRPKSDPWKLSSPLTAFGSEPQLPTNCIWIGASVKAHSTLYKYELRNPTIFHSPSPPPPPHLQKWLPCARMLFCAQASKLFSPSLGTPAPTSPPPYQRLASVRCLSLVGSSSAASVKVASVLCRRQRSCRIPAVDLLMSVARILASGISPPLAMRSSEAVV
jgi:hypothetical protein